MKFAAKALAAAAALALIAGVSAPAMAAGVSQNVQQSQNGGNDIFGLDLQFAQLGNQAETESNAFRNASGNIGLNVGAGNGNQQGNDVLLDANTGSFAFTGDYDQFSAAEGLILSGAEDAAVENNSFEYAFGQVGANVAAGTWNQQSNAAFLASGATLSSNNVHMNQADVFTGCLACGLNTPLAGDLGATISDNAFNYAHGDIEVNVAAGDVNHQMNSLVVAGSPSGPSSIDMDQFDLGHLYLIAGLNGATVEGYAFANAHGNVAVNVTAGSSNQQMNATRVQSCDCGGSKTSSDQDNFASFEKISGLNSAEISGNAFNSAAGAISANVAGGDINQQANALTVAGNP